MSFQTIIRQGGGGGGGGRSSAAEVAEAYIARLIANGVNPTSIPLTALYRLAEVLQDDCGGIDTFQAVYPIIGGTAATHAIDFLGIRNITWSGTVTHSSTGALGDGSTGYGNTGVNPSTLSMSTSSSAIGILTDTTLAGGASKILMGSQNGVNNTTYIAWGSVGTEMLGAVAGTSSELSPSTSRPTDSAGFHILSCDGDRVADYYLDGVATGAGVTQSSTFYNGNLFLLAVNSAGSPATYAPANLKFAFVSAGLSAAQVTALNAAVANLQTALGR